MPALASAAPDPPVPAAGSAHELMEFWPFLPLMFIGIWLFVSFLISGMGWDVFAGRYSAKLRPAGRASFRTRGYQVVVVGSAGSMELWLPGMVLKVGS